MVKIQTDISDKADLSVRLYMAKNNIKSKANAINKILEALRI